MTSSARGEGGKTLLQQLLNLMTLFQQVRAVDPQLVGQMFGRCALGNAAQDEHHLDTRVAASTPDGAGERVEDRATVTAPIVIYGRAMPIMRFLAGRQRMSGRTFQPVGMQGFEQIVVTFLLTPSAISS